MKHKMESRLLGDISTTSDMQITQPLWQKVKRATLMASGPITSRQIDGETVETVRDFYFWGAPKSLQIVIAAMNLKGAYSLEGKL